MQRPIAFPSLAAFVVGLATCMITATNTTVIGIIAAVRVRGITVIRMSVARITVITVPVLASIRGCRRRIKIILLHCACIGHDVIVVVVVVIEFLNFYCSSLFFMSFYSNFQFLCVRDSDLDYEKTRV